MKTHGVIMTQNGLFSRTKKMTEEQANSAVELFRKLYPSRECWVHKFPQLRIVK